MDEDTALDIAILTFVLITWAGCVVNAIRNMDSQRELEQRLMDEV